ncbi:MAG: Mur ligase family protein [Actinomycetota bacterium]
MREIRTARNDLAETIKNTALGFMNLAGLGELGGSVRFSGDPGIYEIAVEYEKEEAARILLETAVEAVEAAFVNESFDIAAKIAEAQTIAETSEQDDSTSHSNQKPGIPIVAITGTNGKTTVTRLTAYTLLQTGLNIGTTTTDGILLNGEIIERGDTTGPASARTILENPAVDIAVLETARGGIMRRGLGWDWADIAVITNITEDHIGQDGIESVADLVNIKSLIAERVRENGTLVLNADDAESAALAGYQAVLKIKKKIVYFAMSEENPILKKHSAMGGSVYFVRNNWICERRGAEVLPIAETTKIPIAMKGTADFQIQNAMAVSAVSRALRLSPEQIAAGLYNFQNAVHNPGRSNFYRVGKGFALIDYGHNPKALEAICRMTSRWHDKTMTGIISFPGDRRDDVIEAAGRIAVAGFDRIIVKGDINLRGRESGEVAQMLCRLVLEAGNQSECKIVLDAAQAFEDAIAGIKENEVVVFFYEKLAPVLATLEKYGAVAAHEF